MLNKNERQKSTIPLVMVISWQQYKINNGKENINCN